MPKIIDFQELFKKRIFNTRVLEKEIPQHICISTDKFNDWIKNNKESPEKASKTHISLLKDLLDWQIKNDLPILTINLAQSTEEYSLFLKQLLDELSQSNSVHDNQIRIFVVGKWYDLSPSIVESIKDVMGKTKDYDRFFLNLCVNYDGQDEIMSSLKLMARKIEAEKLQLEDITKDMIKDNLFTSYFLPPNLMIEAGDFFSGTLLWDCQGAIIHFTRKHWLDFDKNELEIAIDKFQHAVSSKKRLTESSD